MPSGRRYELVLCALVAVLAVFRVVGMVVASGGPPKDPKPDLGYVVNLVFAWVLVAVPWMVAVRRLWRAWWDSRSTMDGPAWLPAASVATLPAARRDWGAAMSVRG